jgi:hypothetical protein
LIFKFINDFKTPPPLTVDAVATDEVEGPLAEGVPLEIGTALDHLGPGQRRPGPVVAERHIFAGFFQIFNFN